MYSPRKCGVKFEPPTLVLYYVVNETGKLHRRSMPVRGLMKDSSISEIAMKLKEHKEHGTYLENIPTNQIERLLKVLQDKLNGKDPPDKPHMTSLIADENLNKLDDEELNKVKAAMDEEFEKHRKRPGDEDFEYDVQVEFNEGKIESGWDSAGSYSDPEF